MQNRPLACGICQKSADFVFLEKSGDYSLWECPFCVVRFWHPMKNPGAGWYERDERYSFRNINPRKKAERNHREFLRDMPARGGKLLDVGMGTGNFLAAAEDKGYDGYGIDFDSGAIETAKRFFGLKNVFVADVKDAVNKFGKGFFDAVTMFEVLEHLEKPAEFVEMIKILLKKDGYLALSVPYRAAPEFLKPHDLPPRHLTRWDEKSLENFLESRGFSVTRVKIIPASLGYLVAKFHFWTAGIFSFNLVQKAREKKNGGKSGGPAESFGKEPLKIKILRSLAKTKDRILFFIPALFLRLYLRLTGRGGLGIYVLARRF